MLPSKSNITVIVMSIVFNFINIGHVTSARLDMTPVTSHYIARLGGQTTTQIHTHGYQPYCKKGDTKTSVSLVHMQTLYIHAKIATTHAVHKTPSTTSV
jgi:hypothetical protein